MMLQSTRHGETAESLQKRVDALFSEAPLSTGLRRLADRHGSLVDPSAGRRRRGREGDSDWALLSPLSLLLLCILLLAGLLLYARIMKGSWLGKEGGSREERLPVPERVTGSASLRQKAQHLARSGEHREAIRLLLLSLLTLISERKLLAMARNLTTREIYARLPKDQESEEQYLAHFFHVFEEASYGGRDVGENEFEDLDGILGRGIHHELLKAGRTS